MVEVPSLGRRGGGWVVLQLVLMGAVVVAAVLGPPWPGSLQRPLLAIGSLAILGGAALGIAAVRALGEGFTPFPRPAGSGRLVTSGPYRAVRHPMYAAGLLLFTGVSLASSPAALVATAALAVLWALKAAVEERLLLARYPGYADYARRVRRRFVPRVY